MLTALPVATMICLLGAAVPTGVSGWQSPDHELQTILAVRIPLGEDPTTLDLPVDTSINQLVVSIQALPRISVTVSRPGGTPAGESDSDVKVSSLKTMDPERQIPVPLRLYTIERPQPGMWRIRLADPSGGNGSPVLVKALGNSPLAFGSFGFVRKQEGVHGGYFEIDGMPLSGIPVTARGRLRTGQEAATFREEATFRLIDETGTRLRRLPLKKGNPDTASDDFLGTFELPMVPFRVVMNAVDESGAPIQRQYSTTFRAQPVAVFLSLERSNVIEPGTKRQFTFAVTNVGTARATYAVNVTATQGDVIDLSPFTVAVEPGTSATPSFSLAIPANADRLLGVELKITAINTVDPSVRNSVSADLELARPDDADNDFVPDDMDNCRDVPNNDQADVNRNAIGDDCDPAEGGPVSVQSIAPQSGAPRSHFRVRGSGFRTTRYAAVLFNGLPAAGVVVSATELTVTVPDGAAVGPVQLLIATEKGFAMSPMPFIVRRPAAEK